MISLFVMLHNKTGAKVTDESHTFNQALRIGPPGCKPIFARGARLVRNSHGADKAGFPDEVAS